MRHIKKVVPEYLQEMFLQLAWNAEDVGQFLTSPEYWQDHVSVLVSEQLPVINTQMNIWKHKVIRKKLNHLEKQSLCTHQIFILVIDQGNNVHITTMFQSTELYKLQKRKKKKYWDYYKVKYNLVYSRGSQMFLVHTGFSDWFLNNF